MRFDILTLFPEFFDIDKGPLSLSIIGRAIDGGLLEVEAHNIRDYTTDSRRTVDDSPYGGGPGMVMKVDPLVSAIEALRSEGQEAKVILLTPQGKRFDQALAAEFSTLERVVVVCGRYEGVDERVRSYVDMELSIGDYLLSGGETAALVLIDAVGRLLPGVITAGSLESESFTEARLEYPQYTRPEEFRGMRVPSVLLSGNHAEIERWREEESLLRTKARRPDLLDKEK